MVDAARPGTGALRLVCFELRGQELALPIAELTEGKFTDVSRGQKSVETVGCAAGA